ncbi:MAG: voltage-gated sodium channel [Maribacter sp.]|jgi:voltage-gated sodium channel
MKWLTNLFMSNKFILSAIVLNSVIITWMAFPIFREHGVTPYPLHSLIMNIDQFFIWFFLIELLVKLKKLGINDYFKSNWNKFDFFLVMVSVPSVLLHIAPDAFYFIPQTSLILVFRMFRLLRMFRFLKFIPNMEHILKGIGRAAKASVFVFVALIFLNFMFGLFTCHMFCDAAPEKFGDPLIAMYSIFQMFTIEGWYEMPQALEGKLSSSFAEGMAKVYFIMIVLIGGVMGMSLVNAIFVDEMTMDNNDDLEDKVDRLQEQIEELKSIILENK